MVVERGVRVGGDRSVAHYWVLRQQGRSGVLPGGVASLLATVAAGSSGGFRGGGLFLTGCPGALPGVGGPLTAVPPVCGVCGLLFENCIVDASIFETPRPPVGG